MRTFGRLTAMVGLVLGLLVGVSNVASAQVYTEVTPPAVGRADVGVLGAQVVRPAPVPTVSAGQLSVLGGRVQVVQQPARVGGLAVTGADIIALLALAMTAVAAGSLAVRMARRPKTQ